MGEQVQRVRRGEILDIVSGQGYVFGSPLYSSLRAPSYTTGRAASTLGHNHPLSGDFLRVHVADIPANRRLPKDTTLGSSRGLSWDMP